MSKKELIFVENDLRMKRKHENLAWLGAWILVFALIPLTMLRQMNTGQPGAAMLHVLNIWSGILPFLLLFVVHHFLILPLFKEKRPLYIGLTATLLVLFAVYCLSSDRPDGPPPAPFPEQMGQRPEGMPGPPLDAAGMPPQPEGNHAPIRPDVMNLLMGILMVGVDLGVFSYVESLRSERRVKELLAESLNQQLESLRYQINPHFFMNTLNNIHALVDIDPEKAKESIEEFSKMMRILLYEGDSPTIPLSRELDFIEHYISLMRLRYPDDTVGIQTLFPDGGSDAVVPPLLMASFVENAFKHGISYETDSSVRVSVEIKEGKVWFRCANTSHPAAGDQGHGLGLGNIRRRLDLLYGSDYTLYAGEMADTYDVLLAIPTKPTVTTA